MLVERTPKQFNGWWFARIIALLVSGAVAGYALGFALQGRLTRWDDVFNVGLSGGLIFMAIIFAVVLAVRPNAMPQGARLSQVIVLALAGVMLAAPMFAPELATWIFGEGVVTRDLVFVGVVILLAVQTILNVRCWLEADEMFRRIILETCTLSFIVLQGAMFLYAAAARLSLVTTPMTAWGMVSVIMGVYLTASCVAVLRRGMA